MRLKDFLVHTYNNANYGRALGKLNIRDNSFYYEYDKFIIA